MDGSQAITTTGGTWLASSWQSLTEVWSDYWNIDFANPTKAEWAGLDRAIQQAKLAICPGGDEIKPALAKLALACRAQNSEPIDRKAQAALMREFIGAYPAEIVTAAVQEWIATKIWWPAVSELREVCERLMIPRRRALVRLQALAGKRDRAREVKVKPTPEEMEAIKARIAAMYPAQREEPMDDGLQKVRDHMAKRREEMRDRIPMKRSA